MSETADNYWQYLSVFIPGGEIPPAPEDPYSLAVYCREVFQRALIWTLSSMDDRANGCYRVFSRHFTEIPPQLHSCHDWVRSYISTWIIEDRKDRNMTKNALQLVKEECRRHFRIYRTCEIQTSLLELDILDRNEYPPPAGVIQENQSKVRYSCEVTGDLLVEAARLCLIRGDRFYGAKLAAKAQELNRKARKAANNAFATEYPQWERFLGRSNRWISKNFSRLSSDYFVAKKAYMGNLDLFSRQAGLLLEISRHTPGSFRADNMKRRFETFFKENISQKGRLDSSLGIMEEVEWMLLKIHYYGLQKKYPGLSPSELLRMSLK